MGFIVSSQGNFTPCPEGVYPAVCVWLFDRGTQADNFGNNRRKLRIGFETPSVLNEDNDNKPYVVWEDFTATIGDKSNLGKMLVAWRGRKFTDEELDNFDLENILGKPCLLTVVHSTDGKWANIGGISALVKGMPKPNATTPIMKFDVDNPDLEVFKTFSEKSQEQICTSPEAQAAGLSAGCTSLSPPQRVDNTDSPVPGEDGPHRPIDESDIPF